MRSQLEGVHSWACHANAVEGKNDRMTMGWSANSADRSKSPYICYVGRGSRKANPIVPSCAAHPPHDHYAEVSSDQCLVELRFSRRADLGKQPVFVQVPGRLLGI